MTSTFPLSRAYPNHVVVVGGGICGATTAAVLAQAGLEVVLCDQASTHAGHLAAALTPVISSDDNARSRLSRLGCTLADQYWRGLQVEVGSHVGAPVGALQLQRPDGAKRSQDLKAQAEVFNQPEWARWVESDEASELAGLTLHRGAIWFAGGWQIEVSKLLDALKATPGVQVVASRAARLARASDHWLVYDARGEAIAQAQAVVLANAFDVPDLLVRSGLADALSACKRLPSLHRLAGEITLLPAQALNGGPRCIVGGDGYVLPAVDGWCVSGGTYVRGATAAECTQAGRQANIDRARALLDLDLDFDLDQTSKLPAWAGWRAVLPGRLPAIGQLKRLENVWVFTAGASRGLTWSVLGAMLIRDGLVGQTQSLFSALDAQMLASIEP